MEQKKKVTIQDIANYTNISVGTIDRVIHKRGKVSDDKRKKIEEAIKKLNFNPNLLARTLALGKSFSICALLPTATHLGHYWSLPKQGIDNAAMQFKDFGIITNLFFYDLFDETSFIEQTNKILRLNPDGVILAPLFINESSIFVQKLKELGISYVFIDSDIPRVESLSYIGPDIKQSAFIAARLLNSVIKKNKDVLILNMFKGIENSAALKRMESGFKKYYREKGIDEERIHILTINSTNKDIVYKELTKFYIKNKAIEGVFVTNSEAHLISGFHTLHELNIRVVGFDLTKENIEELKAGGIDYIISQSPMQQGFRALQTLFELFIYKNIPNKVQYVPLDIIIKENVDFYINFHK